MTRIPIIDQTARQGLEPLYKGRFARSRGAADRLGHPRSPDAERSPAVDPRKNQTSLDGVHLNAMMAFN